MNPYLPLWEHIPDGEPHVFGKRLYLFGSHDRSHGKTFCMDDYVCWSAPLEDLNDWRREGVIYKKQDDPDNTDPIGYLYAPDVAQGPDGRYYLYYFYSGSQQRSMSIRVAVCDTPAGRYSYYGHVALPEHEPYIAFDPAVLVDDDGRIWLYYGSAFQSPKDVMSVQGGAVVELAPDMKTVVSRPKLTVPNLTHAVKTSFSRHPFFEASSMRKINGTYYFIYSSMQSHELCYARSAKPDGPFVYGGVIVSNGDIGFQGNRRATAPIGNNHGSLVQVGKDWYIFYHRQTQGTSFSRQGCAEKITIQADGSIPQVEITSGGLSGGYLDISQPIPAAVCCNILGKAKKMPCVDESLCDGETLTYVSGIKSGDTIGYKYLSVRCKSEIQLSWRYSFRYLSGYAAMNMASLRADGTIIMRSSLDGPEMGRITIRGGAGEWTNSAGVLNPMDGNALYLTYVGKGQLDILQFQIKAKELQP